MSTVTGFTAARMLAIENASVVDGDVVGNDLVLTTHGGSTINAGNVRGPTGPAGADAAPGDVNPTANTTPIRTSNGRVKGATPTATDDLTTKAYVDAADTAAIATAEAYADTLLVNKTGLTKVRMASTVNLTLSGTQTIDGVVGAAGDRVLVKNQTTASGNGIYVMASGAWARSVDADTALELAGSIVAVTTGTLAGGTQWASSFKATDTLGTTAMLWGRMYDQFAPAIITVNQTTNSTGFVTVTHGLPFTPSAVFGSNGNPASAFAVLWGADTFTATTFVARFMNANGGPLISTSTGTYRCLCYP